MMKIALVRGIKNQNVLDPQHCFEIRSYPFFCTKLKHKPLLQSSTLVESSWRRYSFNGFSAVSCDQSKKSFRLGS
jgi:hypothetical protein